MIPILDYEKTENPPIFQRTPPQSRVTEPVQEIIARVRKEGDQALFAYSRLFDKVELTALEVTGEELEAAMEKVDKELISILTSAAENIRSYHSQQKRTGFSFSPEPGVVLGQKITPMEKVGIYVPGGTAAYPSTVLMTAILAKIAGCGEIVMVTPPGEKWHLPGHPGGGENRRGGQNLPGGGCPGHCGPGLWHRIHPPGG